MNGFLKAVEEDDFLQFKKINTFAAPFGNPFMWLLVGLRNPLMIVQWLSEFFSAIGFELDNASDFW